MSELLEACEFCGKEKSATYSQIGVGIMGAAMCPRCKRVTQSQNFKTEFAHMLATGEGDLDKFFKLNQQIIPICKKCGCDLKASNWTKSSEEKHDFVCNACKYASTKKNRAKKALSVDNTNIVIRIKSAHLPLKSPNQMNIEVRK